MKAPRLLFLVVAVILLVGCSKPAPTATPQPAAQPPSQATAAPAPKPAATQAPAPTTAPKPPAKVTTFRLAHEMPPSNIRQVGAEKLAQLLDQKTGGQYKIEIFHSAMLFKAAEIPKAVSSGSLDMGVSVNLQLQPLVKGWEIGLLSGVFDSRSHFEQFENHAQGGKKLLKELERVNIKGGTVFDSVGDTGIFVNVPIKGMDDLKGLKLMSASPMMNDTMQSVFGAITQNVPAEEAVTALQTGMVHGRFTGPVPGVSMNLQEQAKWHYLMPGFLFADVAIIMNLDKWNALPADVKRLLDDEIFPEVQKHARAQLARVQEDSIATMKKAGVTIVTMTDKERATARDRLAPVWAKWEPQIGKEYIDLARSIAK